MSDAPAHAEFRLNPHTPTLGVQPWSGATVIVTGGDTLVVTLGTGAMVDTGNLDMTIVGFGGIEGVGHTVF